MKLNRVLLCLGLAGATLRMWDTLAHSWNPAFQAPVLPLWIVMCVSGFLVAPQNCEMRG
jgi:hypothetical protein